MKTDALIGLLATGAGPAPRAVAARRLVPALGVGLLASALGAVFGIGLIPADLFANPAWWIKISYAAMLALTLGWLAARLARPVARLSGPGGAVWAVAGVMALLGVLQLVAAEPDARMTALMGSSAALCPWRVLVLSVPAMAGAFWALRGLAPTRLRLAGFVAGLAAGAVGATGYALACGETSMTFVAVWYSLGIVMAGGVGALLGPRLLRW